MHPFVISWHILFGGLDYACTSLAYNVMPWVVSITNDHDNDDTDKIEVFFFFYRKVLSLLIEIDYIFQNTKKKRAQHLE